MATGQLKITEATLKPSVDNTDYIVTTSGTSVYRTSVQDLINKANEGALTAWDEAYLDKLTDGVFNVYEHHQSATSHFKIKQPASQCGQRINDNLIGVCIPINNREIIVGTEQTSLRWGNGTTTSRIGADMTRVNAQLDFNGKSKTAAIVAAMGAGTDYAAGWCMAYSRLNTNNEGAGAGSWWLPSFGEMIAINNLRQRINIMLSLKTGTTLIGKDTFQTSSENGSSNYLTYSTDYGTMVIRSKDSVNKVIPITDYWV